MVRDIMLEDLQGFLKRTDDISYGVDVDNPTFEGEPEARDLARAVKRAWNAEADHNFMRSVTKIHWMKSATDQNMNRLLSSNGRDEISTMGYISGPYGSGPDGWPVWGNVGFVIDGRVTLAANTMNSIFSGYHKNVPADVREKYKSSGLRKRAAGFGRWKSEDYILDASSFNPKMQGENEFIVAGWKVTNVIITEYMANKVQEVLDTGKFEDWQIDEYDRIFSFIEKSGIPYLKRKHKNLAQRWLADLAKRRGENNSVTDVIHVAEGKIRRIVREVLTEGESSSRYAITTFPDPLLKTASFTIAYDVDALERVLQGDEAEGVVLAGVGVDVPRSEDGHCNGAKIVGTGGSIRSGWGTRVYLAAMDSIGAMAPDREHVSPAAEALWKSLIRRELVVPTEFDDIKDPKTPPWQDDCRVYKTRDGALNASYKLNGDPPSDVIDLQSIGWKHMKDLEGRGLWEAAAEILMSGYDNAYRESFYIKRPGR